MAELLQVKSPPPPGPSSEPASPPPGDDLPDPPTEKQTSGSLWSALAGKWQIPLFLAGLALLASGLPRLFVKPAGPTLEDRLVDIRQTFQQGKFDDVVARIEQVKFKELTSSQQAQLLLIRGLSHWAMANSAKGDARESHARRAAEDLDAAVESAGSDESLDGQLIGSAEFFARRGEARLWARSGGSLDQGEADLVEALRRLNSGQDELRKQLILVLWNISPAVVHRELDQMLDRKDLDLTDQVWAVRRKARLLAEISRLPDAVRLLEDYSGKLAGGSNQDAVEIELARLHYEASTDLLNPPTPGERERHLDQAHLLLSAVRLRRVSLPGEEELDGELHWLLGEVCFLQDRPEEAAEAFDTVLRRHSNTRFKRVAQLGVAKSAALYRRFDRSVGAYQQVVADLRTQADDPLIDRRAVRDTLLSLSEQARREEQWDCAYKFLVLVEDVLDPFETKPSPAEIKEKQGAVLRKLAAAEKQAGERILRDAAAGRAATTQPEEAERLRAQARLHLRMAADAFLMAARHFAGDDRRCEDDLEAAAACYDEAGETLSAIQVLKRFIQEYPGEQQRVARAVYGLGKAYQAAGQYSNAVEQYLRMTTEFAKSPDANKSLVPMAQCCKALGEFDEAERVLTNLLRDDEIFSPDSQEYCEALFELAKLKYERRQYRQAIARFDELLQRERGPRGEQQNARAGGDARHSLHSRYYLADSYRLSGLELDSAIASAKTVLERRQLHQTQSQWLTQARALFDEAVAKFEAAAGPDRELGDPDRVYLRNSYFFRADCVFDLGLYEEAIGLYDLAALKYQSRPEVVAAYVQIVNCYQRLGKPEQARTANERAKWLLKNLPSETFSMRPLPLGKEYFEQWLDWIGKSGL